MKLNIIQIGILTLLLLFLSCTTEKQSRVPEDAEVEHETPKVLLEENYQSNDLIGRYKIGYTGNVVERLFEEACSKNPELTKLNEAYEKSIAQTTKLIQEFSEYEILIAGIWESVDLKAELVVNDTILRKSLLDQSTASKKAFEKKVKLHRTEIAKLKEKVDLLKNQMTELKIKTTLSMMKGYQDNEIPPLELFTKGSKALDSLNEEMKQILE